MRNFGCCVFALLQNTLLFGLDVDVEQAEAEGVGQRDRVREPVEADLYRWVNVEYVAADLQERQGQVLHDEHHLKREQDKNYFGYLPLLCYCIIEEKNGERSRPFSLS